MTPSAPNPFLAIFGNPRSSAVSHVRGLFGYAVLTAGKVTDARRIVDRVVQSIDRKILAPPASPPYCEYLGGLRDNVEANRAAAVAYAETLLAAKKNDPS